jgi:hypothetical protein
MSSLDLAVVTMTHSRSDLESNVLLASLKQLARCGLRVAVADGGSSPAFVDRMRRLPGFEVCRPERPGLVGQMLAGFALIHAWKVRHVLYTEPDKELFFAIHLGDFLSRAEADHAEIVLAARSPAGFETFPPTQRLTEHVLNLRCGGITGLTTDYCYGPFLVSAELLHCLATAPLDLGWGWRPLLFVLVARLGLRIGVVEGDFSCPEAQRNESAEDRIHRWSQLAQNLRGVTLASKARLPTVAAPLMGRPGTPRTS